MWEMIMSLIGGGGESAIQNAYSGSDALKDAGDMTMGMDSGGTSGFSTMDKLGSFGKEQLGSEFSPYVNGINDLKNIYNQLKGGNGLLGTNAGSQDPTALSSAARLFSSTGLLGGDSGMAPMPNQMPQITVMQNGGLGMPSANMAPRQNQILPFASNLARQAYGNYL